MKDVSLEPLLLITRSALVRNLLLSDSRGANHLFPAASHGWDLHAGTAAHPGSNRWTAFRQRLGGWRAGHRRPLIAEIRCASGQKRLLLGRGYRSPGTNGDTRRRRRHLWQVMIAQARIWVMTDLGRLLLLKSPLLRRSSAWVRQRHVPELPPARVTDGGRRRRRLSARLRP